MKRCKVAGRRVPSVGLSLLCVLAGLVTVGPAAQAEPHVASRDAESVVQSPGPPLSPPPLASAPAAPPAPVPADPVVTAVRALLGEAKSAKLAGDAADRQALAAYYTAHGTAVWVSGSGLNPKAGAAIAFINEADDWGLDARAFSLPAPFANGAVPSAEELAGAELKLSVAALAYARFARGGRIPDPTATLSSSLDRKPHLADPNALLGTLAQSEAPGIAAVLANLHPQAPQFARLREALVKIRHTNAAAAATTIPAGPRIKPGERNPAVAILRHRFGLPVPKLEGLELDDWVYDPALADTVKAFQGEHQLKTDGILNDKTRAALNAKPAVTASLIIATMEQWRWMPEDLGAFYVTVNIPEFMVRVVRQGKVIHSERVVTGMTDPEKQTPVFSDQMRSIVFQPQWGLPESIKEKEILPRLQRGDGLRAGLRMQRNGHDIDPDDVNWSKADMRNYLVFQPAGDDNALGVVKFLFPNKHQVYLHDTPSKGLFNSSSRTFSHGCVRVRNPVHLAELILEADKGWTPATVTGLVNDGPQDNKVALSTPVPVHITYFTAVVGDDGVVKTFPDVYGHERRITQALAGKWSDIDRPDDHLAPVTIETSGNDVDQPAPKHRRARADAGDQTREARRPRRSADSGDGGSRPSRRRQDDSVGGMILRALGGL